MKRITRHPSLPALSPRPAVTTIPAPASALSRRDFARGVALGLAAGALGACGRSAGVAAASAAPACTLYPAQMEGPFYLDAALVRRDIREGRPGAPLRLALRIVAAGTCAPLAGLAVDVWHCDAAGVYSGHPGQLGGADTRGETFLRGTQPTDADGRVAFDTIYPGWYPGRTTHVHFKVRVGERAEATSQIYFPEDATAAVYASAPYAARGPKDTTNERDGVVRHEGAPPLAVVARTASGLAASIVVAIAEP